MPVVLPSTSWLAELRRAGRLVCRCEEPAPELVYLLGWAPVPGAYECRRCRRKVVG